MKEYIKKQPPIKAVQFFDTDECKAELQQLLGIDSLKVEYPKKQLIIKTRESEFRVNEGDYVIKGSRGGFYPCDKNIFEASYEDYAECMYRAQTSRSAEIFAQ